MWTSHEPADERPRSTYSRFSEWLAREDFEGCVEGCAFVTSLLATVAGAEDPERFAGQWHILAKGSIVAAHEGDRDAAPKARELGELLLEHHGVGSDALGRGLARMTR